MIHPLGLMQKRHTKGPLTGLRILIIRYPIVYDIQARVLMAANRREFLLGAATLAATTSFPSLALAAGNAGTEASAQTAHAASPFLLEFDGGALTSLRFAADAFPTNYVATGQKLGPVEIAWRRPIGCGHSPRASEQRTPLVD